MHGVSGQRSLGPTTGWLASIWTAELHLHGKLLLLPLMLQLQEESCEPRIDAAGREGVYRCDRGRGKGVKNYR